MTREELSQVTTGYITSDMDFDDYGLKAGVPEEVYKTNYGGAIFPHHGDEIRLNNREVRDDLLPHLTHSLIKP